VRRPALPNRSGGGQARLPGRAGYDIGWVMDQLGYADGRLTMAVYCQWRRHGARASSAE
jgi:hypothetical protein